MAKPIEIIREQLEPDVVLTGRAGDTVLLLTPQNDKATAWIDEHTDDEAQFMGISLAVEYRYIRDIVHGMINDGLQVAER